MRYSQTTGHNLIETFKKQEADGKGKPVRFKARGKGVDRRGEPVYNDFTIVSIHPVKGNHGWTAVKAATHTGTVELHLRHNDRFTVED